MYAPLLRFGNVANDAADREQRRAVLRQEPVLDERQAEALVRLAVRAGIADRGDVAVGEAALSGPLHLEQEELERVVGPRELEPAAGERAGVDLGARVVRVRQVRRAAVDRDGG
jgi:hypothetical protein